MEVLSPVDHGNDAISRAYADSDFAGAWSSLTLYRKSQIVTYAGEVWVANAAPIIGATPGISGSWTRIGFLNYASGSTSGAMQSTDFTKLAAIAAGAEVNAIQTVTSPLAIDGSRNLSVSGYQQGIVVRVDKGGTNQTGILTSTTTKITWPRELDDPQAKFASDRFTPGKAGFFSFSGFLYISPAVGTTPAANTLALISVFKNGAAGQECRSLFAPVANGVCLLPYSFGVDSDNATDYFELYIWQNSGQTCQIEGASNLAHWSIMEGGTAGLQGPAGTPGSASLDTGIVVMLDKNAVAQTGIATATETLVAFANVLYDPQSKWNTSTNRFTPGKVGVFEFRGQVYVASTAGTPLATSQATLRLYKNGVYVQDNRALFTASASSPAPISVSMTANATAPSDYFELRVIQNSGNTTQIDGTPNITHVEIAELGGVKGDQGPIMSPATFSAAGSMSAADFNKLSYMYDPQANGAGFVANLDNITKPGVYSAGTGTTNAPGAGMFTGNWSLLHLAAVNGNFAYRQVAWPLDITTDVRAERYRSSLGVWSAWRYYFGSPQVLLNVIAAGTLANGGTANATPSSTNFTNSVAVPSATSELLVTIGGNITASNVSASAFTCRSMLYIDGAFYANIGAASALAGGVCNPLSGASPIRVTGLTQATHTFAVYLVADGTFNFWLRAGTGGGASEHAKMMIQELSR